MKKFTSINFPIQSSIKTQLEVLEKAGFKLPSPDCGVMDGITEIKIKSAKSCDVATYYKLKNKGHDIVPCCFGCGRFVSEDERTVSEGFVGTFFKCKDCDEQSVLWDMSDHVMNPNR